MAHKGKATSDVDYNPKDPPSAYTNETVHNRLSQYTEMARSVHGPEYDPTTAELDPEVIMRVGGGKKHGRYWIADSTLDTATTPTLAQIRARSTSSCPPICPRPGTAQHRMETIQVTCLCEIVWFLYCILNCIANLGIIWIANLDHTSKAKAKVLNIY